MVANGSRPMQSRDMADSVLLIDKKDGVTTLTLNRPQAMNALSRELRRALIKTFGELADDADTKVVILTGSGRAFCAGLDLKELGGEVGSPAKNSAGAPSAPPSQDSAQRALSNETEAAVSGGELVQALARLEQPIIGAINGFAITGGFELALACDVLIASSEARFADTHARVGIMPGWGLSQKLSRAIGIYRAKELSLTGNYLPADLAAQWGLVSRVVPPAELLPTCERLARDMLSCDPVVLRSYKKVIDDGFAQSFGDGMRLEAEASRRHVSSVKPEAIAERRAAVQERGRSQSRGGDA
jgi:enoyl-CoA hydratase